MRWRALLSTMRVGSLPWLLALSLVGFALTDALAFYRMLPGICGALTLGTVAELTRLSIDFTGLSGLLSGWAIMLLAMMPPLVSAPVNHVVASSLPRRRLRATLLLFLGYGVAWLAAGLLLIPFAIATMLVLAGAAFPVMLVVALLWSCSPWGQVARNRCHRTSRIGLRGWRADRDCIRQGLLIAPWCILSCAPWMVAAMVAGSWHVAAMLAVTLYLGLDRLLPAARPSWRAPAVAGYLRTARIV